ncbi:MAG TPA: hypothetical protein VHZ73_02020, partial [Vicinamibacterales bacterium]|nr:hypothetical protein [Vicinamibacterales bacterium]
MTLLERRLREAARGGATTAIVAAAPIELPPSLPISVEWVAPGTPPPDNIGHLRADIVDGIVVHDEGTRRLAEW